MLHAFQDERIRVYMLANQLPLMQLGRDAPQVVGEIDEYCRPGGTKHEKAILKELFVVAFSDPNDVLSYAIPPNYADESMDSRLCPTVVNVSINLVPVTKIFGLGEVANPFEAHEGYDNDPRVIGLIVRGIGQDKVDDAVSEGCTWMRTVE